MSGIGAAVRRLEDERFLTGRGCFVDDLLPPGTAFAQVLRSPHAHARIQRIDTAAARAASGVLAVLTGDDVVREGIGALPCAAFPEAGFRPLQPILAIDKVRHVGEAVALVVAETASQAADAAELIEVDYVPLPAVTLEDAQASAAPRVWDEARDNVSSSRSTMFRYPRSRSRTRRRAPPPGSGTRHGTTSASGSSAATRPR